MTKYFWGEIIIKAIIKSILALSLLNFSTFSFAGEVVCKCLCDAPFFEDQVITFPAKGDNKSEEKKYCEANNEEECVFVLDGEEANGFLKDCERKVIDETQDTLKQLGTEMK